jgi:hypothetical protein
MNPNQQQQYQPQSQPGMSPFAAPQQQAQPVPSYATDPQALLRANGTIPAAPAAGTPPAPMAMPQPPATGQSAPASSGAFQQQVPSAAPQAPQFIQPAPVPPSVIPNQQATVGGAVGTPNQPGTAPGVKPVVSNPNSTQNMLQIAEIRDGIVIMNDGSYRSVVMVNSINFDLMSRAEQESVEFSYQNFLNSLYFPIQIFIRSQKVDMTPYIDKLDRIRAEHDNMLLSLLMDDYVGYIEGLAQQTNIMDKKFYIVVPFFPHIDVQKSFTQSKNFITGFAALFGNKEQKVVINEADLAKAKDELRNRVQTVLDGLLQCNIQSLPLDTQELIELYYDTYNPDTATRQQLKNFNNMDVDIVGKGDGVAPQPNLDRELV